MDEIKKQIQQDAKWAWVAAEEIVGYSTIYADARGVLAAQMLAELRMREGR